MTFFLSTVVYFVTMHPHMGILYHPWQYFTSIAPPYWEQFADTVSGNFHVSWIMCCTVVVWLVETIWERYPFNLIKNDWASPLCVLFRHHRHRPGHALLPVLRPGTDLGRGHPRHPQRISLRIGAGCMSVKWPSSSWSRPCS